MHIVCNRKFPLTSTVTRNCITKQASVSPPLFLSLLDNKLVSKPLHMKDKYFSCISLCFIFKIHEFVQWAFVPRFVYLMCPVFCSYITRQIQMSLSTMRILSCCISLLGGWLGSNCLQGGPLVVMLLSPTITQSYPRRMC